MVKRSYRKLLSDEVTGLPTIPLVLEDIKKVLRKRGQIGLLYLEIANYHEVEELLSWKVFDHILKEIARALKRLRGKVFDEKDFLSVSRTASGGFLIFLSQEGALKTKDLMNLKTRIDHSLHKYLDREFNRQIQKRLSFYIGYSSVMADSRIRPSRAIYRAIDEAMKVALDYEERTLARKIVRLEEIIHQGKIHTLFQPILRLSDQKVIGYEALSRGPKGTEFESPELLFELAAAGKMVWLLERLCRQKTLENSRKLPRGAKLFINVEPPVVADPLFRNLEPFERMGLRPEDIVLEITERSAIKDFKTFKKALEFFRRAGFKVALDDTGSGYATLHALWAIRPDYLKIAASLIHYIDKAPLKQQLLKMLLLFAKEGKCKTIAEGVERREEFWVIKEAGVDFIQGFLFARPGKPFPKPRKIKL
jgi:EAL domain-containing protein (putative c-di-GMP-specific phosphodiesterase class I)/GGDEF domain-containing protein